MPGHHRGTDKILPFTWLTSPVTASGSIKFCTIDLQIPMLIRFTITHFRCIVLAGQRQQEDEKLEIFFPLSPGKTVLVGEYIRYVIAV